MKKKRRGIINVALMELAKLMKIVMDSRSKLKKNSILKAKR